ALVTSLKAWGATASGSARARVQRMRFMTFPRWLNDGCPGGHLSRRNPARENLTRLGWGVVGVWQVFWEGVGRTGGVSRAWRQPSLRQSPGSAAGVSPSTGCRGGGDRHATQGNGGVCLTAIETSLKGTFQFIVRKNLKLRWPRAETPTHCIVMGLDLDFCI